MLLPFKLHLKQMVVYQFLRIIKQQLIPSQEMDQYSSQNNSFFFFLILAGEISFEMDLPAGGTI